MGPQPPKPKKYPSEKKDGHPPKRPVSEVTHICDTRLARFCIWTNRVNPLLQAAKIMYEHNPMEEPTTKPRRCGAKTRSGTPCAKYPLAGKRRCRLHGGLSTGPKTAAGRARIAAANTRHGKYVGWRAHREREKYYSAEIRRLMAEAKAAGLLEGK